jgi:hypothetical protein
VQTETLLHVQTVLQVHIPLVYLDPLITLFPLSRSHVQTVSQAQGATVSQVHRAVWAWQLQASEAFPVCRSHVHSGLLTLTFEQEESSPDNAATPDKPATLVAFCRKSRRPISEGRELSEKRTILKIFGFSFALSLTALILSSGAGPERTGGLLFFPLASFIHGLLSRRIFERN